MLPRVSLAASAECECCRRGAIESPPASRSISRSVWEIVTGALSVGVWVLMPKCPVCLAAHVALWTGLGLSFAAAKYVRWGLMLLSATALLCLVARRFAKRTTRRHTQAARQAL